MDEKELRKEYLKLRKQIGRLYNTTFPYLGILKLQRDLEIAYQNEKEKINQFRKEDK